MRILLACCLWLISWPLAAQIPPMEETQSAPFLTLQDTVFLHIGNYDEKIYEHTIQPKQTLYSLAKFFGLEVADLIFYNTDLQFQTLRPGQRVKIPIPNRAIIRYKTADYRAWTHIPVYYVVQRGDTFYGIAKRYFKMSVDELQFKNKLETTVVKEGQQIHVGWMSIEGIPEEFREISGSPLQKLNNSYRKQYLHKYAGRKESIQVGKAVWQKNNDTNAGLLALHRSAPEGSLISITNPDNNITFYAEVIGKIPARYDNNVVVVLSPTIARALGAVDEQFFVKVCRYR